MTRNYTSGKWAIAIVGRHEWMRDCAIGDGITSALCSLVGRFRTREEAENEATRLNDAQPGVMPGGPGAWVFEARPYVRADYIGSQNLSRGQNRDCDRRIASGH